MRTCRAIQLVPVCGFALAALLAATSAGAQAPRPWSRVVTPDVTIVTAMAPSDARRVSAALATFGAALRRLVPSAQVDPLAPTVVFAFDRFDAYQPFAPRYGSRVVPVAGSFVGSPQANYLALVLDDRPRAWNVAYHELTHLVVNQSMARPPTWFNEGLAEYYSTFVLGADGSAQLGHPIPEHVVLLKREPWLGLDDLLVVDTKSALYNESDRRSTFYAQSWAFVHFLLNGGEARLAQLLDFLSRTAEGQGTPSAFRAAFGMAPATMQEELRRYVDTASWVPRAYDVGAVTGTDLRLEPITEAQGQAALTGLLLSLDRADEAHGLALGAASVEPGCGPAWAMLAAAHVRQHLDVEAVPFLRRALSLRISGDPIAAYHAGASAIRIHERAGERVLPRRDAARLARAALEQAVAAHPSYADAWATLAHAWLLDGAGPQEALAASRRARSLAPRRDEYALLEAQALMQADDLAAARAVLDDLLQQEIEPALGEQAMHVLARITALEVARARPR